MVKYDEHYTVKFAKMFLDFVKQGTIEGFRGPDKILLEHLLRGKITDYGKVKLIDEAILKNQDVLDKYEIDYESLSSKNDEVNLERPVYDRINIQITGDNNIIEVRLPWLPKDKFDILIGFFKKKLDLQFEFRHNSEGVWFSIIRDENIFDELLNHPLVKVLGYDIDEEKVKKAKQRLKVEIEKQKKLFELSVTAEMEETEEFKGMFEKLYPFQKVAVEYSKLKRSILIADEMGLGKTIEALAIIEYHQSYPALIVVPAMLKKNWKREVNAWLPHKSVVVVETNKIIPPADLYVVSYSMASKVANRFVVRKPKVIVCDECFVFGTKIITDMGLLDIGEIVENKLPIKILSKNKNGDLEYKQIIKWHKYKKEKKDIILRIKLQNDIFIDVTPNHNIYFGDNKYVRADEIKKEDELFVLWKTIDEKTNKKEKQGVFTELLGEERQSNEKRGKQEKITKDKNRKDLRNLWRNIFGDVKQKRDEKKILFDKLLSKMENESTGDKRKGLFRKSESKKKRIKQNKLSKKSTKSYKFFGKNEEKQSKFSGRCEKENKRINERKNFFSSWWKWSTNQTTKNVTRSSWRQLEDGIFNINKEKRGRRRIQKFTNSLFGRFSLSGKENCGRSRRKNTSNKKMEIFRQKENSNIIKVRVENIEILELGCGQRYNESKERNRCIYDITVKDNHNYFANGILVSNSHYLKNPKAARTEFILKNFKDVPFKMLTTGTPILNRTVELVPQLDLLGILDSHFGGKRKFINRYAPPQWNGYGTTYGSANEEELQVELRKSCMIRRMKKDVLTELPDKIRQVVYLPLSDKAAYEKVERDSINWYETKLRKQDDLEEYEIQDLVEEKLENRSALAEKMVRVEYLRQAAVEYKMKAVFEWIDDALEQTNKLIIFAYHRDAVEQLFEHYKNKAVMLYGGMSGQVEDIVNKFINDKRIQLFITSVQSGGIGIDGLQDVCDKVAFVELPWTPALLYQAEDRAHRIRQKNAVNIYYLIGEDTIEEHVYGVVVEKEEIFDKAININKLFIWMKKRKKEK